MSAHLLFDKLAYVDRLKASGVDEQQARAHADGLDQAFREEVATKRDIVDLEAKIAELKTDLKADNAELRTELKSDVAELRTELKADIADLKTDIAYAKNAILIAVITVGAAIIGGLVTMVMKFVAP
jgi:predicted  nucleic acid-binding Zn-ribbon protein